MCILNWSNKRNNSTLSSNDAYKKIAYIQVLEYAAEQARGVGYQGNKKGYIGFKLCDIERNLAKEKIDSSWLKEILPDICTIRFKNKEIGRPASQEYNRWEEYTFVIKSDEYIKFITLESSDNANKSLVATISSLRVAINSLWIAIITLIVTIAVDFFDLKYKSLMDMACWGN